MEITNEKAVEQALKAYEAVNNGDGSGITDADTILADIMEGDTDYRISGLGENILKNWRQSKDKEMYEALFYDLAGIEFAVFVRRCLDETSSH